MHYSTLATFVAGAAMPLMAIAAPYPLPHAVATAGDRLMYDESATPVRAMSKKIRRTNHEAGSEWLKNWVSSSSSEYYPSWTWANDSINPLVPTPTGEPAVAVAPSSDLAILPPVAGETNVTSYVNMTGAMIANKTSHVGYSKAFPLMADTEYVLYMNSTGYAAQEKRELTWQIFK
jgi:hypothetical protein